MVKTAVRFRLAARHKLLLLTLWCAVSVLFLTGFALPRLVDRPYSARQTATLGELRQRYQAQTPPVLGARAFLLYDMEAEARLLADHADKALPPASLTKLMTALLIFEQNELTRTVTIIDADLVGDAAMGLVAGERLTVEQLLWGMLLPSGNDAATALARSAAGSVDAFVAQMNRRAAALGMAQSHFANPHGLDAADQVSSAADLLLLTRQLWRYPLFQEMVQSHERTVAGHRLRNTNELLFTMPGAIGVKTGTSSAAGQCLIAMIQRDGRAVLLIVLGSRDRYADARTLYGYYRNLYQWLAPKANELALLDRLVTRDGLRWYLRPVGAAPARLVRSWEVSQVRVFRRLSLPPADLPWTPGLEVGVVEWQLGGKSLGVQRLVLW
ncbi:MAG TPA: serine hydrolase [Caldilineaceae bacterium]|nr:serine hydrolase [Caldilineaceae bacterium]